MTETGALSPADVMAMTNSEGLGGNNAFFWIFALLLLGGMGNGGFYGGGYKPQYATQGDVQNSFNFSDLQDQNRDIRNGSERCGYVTGEIRQHQCYEGCSVCSYFSNC